MEWTSTRDASVRLPFLAAVAANAPADGGLFIPAARAPWDDAAALLALPWPARNVEILGRLLGDELERATIAELAATAFDFPVPLVAVEPRRFALELFHGPSLSFKDFGVRFLAGVLGEIARREGPASARRRTILTATSGDTGAAVALAFHQRRGFDVAVLFPHGRVAPRQELQMASLGGNVRAFAVDGNFDDCQGLVKACFTDPVLSAELGLVSANSINPARLLAQVLYYFEGLAALRRLQPDAPAPVVCVPSGNFGNLCAGLLARRLGAPLAALALATNANTTVPDYLASGAYRPRSSIATLSNAMDVGAPNNWERIAWLCGGELARLRRELRWGHRDDAGTRAELARLAALGYRADPHGAVASAVLGEVLHDGEIGLFLATAHPAKFDATAEGVPLPPALAEALARPSLAEPLAADPEALRAALRQAVSR